MDNLIISEEITTVVTRRVPSMEITPSAITCDELRSFISTIHHELEEDISYMDKIYNIGSPPSDETDKEFLEKIRDICNRIGEHM